MAKKKAAKKKAVKKKAAKKQQAQNTRYLTPVERKEFTQIKKTQGKEAARDFRQGVIQQNYGTDISRYNLGTAEGAIGASYDLGKQQVQDAHQMNRMDQVDQYGNTVSFRQDPETGQWIQESGMGDAAGGMYDWIQNQMPGAMDQWNTPFDTSGMQELGNVEAERQRIEGELYGRYERDISDQYEKDLSRFQQQMAERGIPMGSEAYAAEMDRMDQQRQQQLQDARSYAVEGAGSEAQRIYQQQLGTRQQQYGEAQYGRSLPFNELSQMGSLAQGLYGPSFQGYNQIQMPYTDVTGTSVGWGGINATTRGQDIQKQLAMQGGGGGGGSPATPWEELEARRREQLQWNWANNPEYNQPQQKQPKGMSAGQQILAGAASGLASGFGQGMANAF